MKLWDLIKTSPLEPPVDQRVTFTPREFVGRRHGLDPHVLLGALANRGPIPVALERVPGEPIVGTLNTARDAKIVDPNDLTAVADAMR